MKPLLSKLTNSWLGPYVLAGITIVIMTMGIELLYQLFVAVESIIETSALQAHQQIIYNH